MGGRGASTGNSKSSRFIKNWEVYDKIPPGWVEVEGATTVPNGYILISNNKSYFGGQRKSALIKIR